MKLLIESSRFVLLSSLGAVDEANKAMIPFYTLIGGSTRSQGQGQKTILLPQKVVKGPAVNLETPEFLNDFTQNHDVDNSKASNI